MDKLIETKLEKEIYPDAWERDEWVRRRAIQLPAESRVLDVGAGSSKYSALFTHVNYKTQDFCQYEGELVQYLRPIDYVCDLVEIPLPDASLDVILCTEVFEHVTDPLAAMREFARLLKPGGLLWLTAPAASQPHMEPYHFYGGFTRYWYEHWLPASGFTINEIKATGGPSRCLWSAASQWNQSWKKAEKSLDPLRRVISLLLRMAFRPFIRIMLPFLGRRMDPVLGSDVACTGFMVEGVRIDG